MANEYVADGIYRVSGLKTKMKDGAWSSDPGMYLVADELKLLSITGASPGEIAFTAGYQHVWQLDADGTTWVEVPMANAAIQVFKAVPASTLSIGGGWVDLAMTRDPEEVLAAAVSGHCVISLLLDSTTNIICHQSDTFKVGSNESVTFTGLMVDTVLLVVNIKITASSAQAIIVGTIPLS